MKIRKLSKAIRLAVTGSALACCTMSTVSAHVMYSTFNQGEEVGLGYSTDGWNLRWQEGHSWVGTGGTASQVLGATSNGSDITSATPFGFSGYQALNWAAMIHTTSESHTVSRADALATYGVAADIDTAKGAWFDGELGWAHQSDYGLIKAMEDTKIKLSLSNIGGDWTNFGVTVFTGMDTGLGSYNKHSGWNQYEYTDFSTGEAIYDPNAFTYSNPHGTTGLNYLTHSETSDLEFTALAGQEYTVILGGNDAGHYGYPINEYSLSITATSPVPVPAAAWLLGSGLIGLLSYRRKNNSITS